MPIVHSKLTRRLSIWTASLVLALLLSAVAFAASGGIGAPMKATLAYDASGKKLAKGARIAYLGLGVSNPYLTKLQQGIMDAATKYGLEVKVFSSEFNRSTQHKQVQDAIAQKFDAYLIAPVTQSGGCADFKLLQKTGKPVEVHNIPICTYPDYPAGANGFVAMQGQKYFSDHVMNAFKSCTKPCEVAAVGGFIGSDLFTFWENAIKLAKAKYPNVNVVVDQPGNFDPRAAFKVIQDGLQAHPNISVVISSWDDMTRGAVQAIQAAHKKPGTDIRIYSVGGTKDALSKINSGVMTETTVLLPYEEGYYPIVHLAKRLATGKSTPGYTNEADAPAVTTGPKTLFITKANAASFKPEY